MGLFRHDTDQYRCGAIVDIGSGSVGVAIVVTNKIEKKLDVVWSYREYMLIKSEQSLDTLVREISVTIMNAMLELSNNGLKALREFHAHMDIEEIQVALSAPWSYTVTKNINYKDDELFTVSKSLIEELVETARKETMSKMLDGKLIEDLGLRIINEATVQVRLNGYAVDDPIGNSCKSLSLSHIHEVAKEKVILTLEDAHNKLFPRTRLHMYSFVYLYYEVLKHLYPDTTEVCLIDVTNEATEIGIVRDNVLQHTTHTPLGIYTLAREVAAACSIPKEEALSIIKDESGAILKAYSEEKRKAITEVFTAYEAAIAKLFADTGDKLSIPRSLFLHTDKNTEPFFSEHIRFAAKQATSIEHIVHLLTSELLGERTMQDTALALSIHYFYTQERYVTPLYNL